MWTLAAVWNMIYVLPLTYAVTVMVGKICKKYGAAGVKQARLKKNLELHNDLFIESHEFLSLNIY